MLKKIAATIKENGLIWPGDVVMVGLSGGPDSVALFHGLLGLRERLSFSLAAAHLNHKLRGPDSEEDEQFVRELAEKHSVALIVGSRDVKGIRRRRGGSMEEVAREVRYDFLIKAAGKVGATKIALGHNMDDNAETVLMNLMRGSGLKGLSGIPLSRIERGFVIIRPLLEVTRKEILSFLKRERLRYREDVSNVDTSLTRNKIRHELLPLLAKEYNPRIERVLAETARNLRHAQESVSGAMADLEKESVRSVGGKLYIDINRLKVRAPGVWRELLRRLLREQLGVSVERHVLDGICQLVAGTRTRSIGLGKGWVACREYDELLLREEKERVCRFQKELRVPCEVRVAELAVQISARFAQKGEVKVRPEPHFPLGEVWRRARRGEAESFDQVFDAAAVRGRAIVVRNRREGDSLRPAGMRGRKKVKELFIDEKVPVTMRDRIPIFCCGEEIMWVAGYRPAAKFAVEESTQKVLRVAVKVLSCGK